MDKNKIEKGRINNETQRFFFALNRILTSQLLLNLLIISFTSLEISEITFAHALVSFILFIGLEIMIMCAFMFGNEYMTPAFGLDNETIAVKMIFSRLIAPLFSLPIIPVLDLDGLVYLNALFVYTGIYILSLGTFLFKAFLKGLIEIFDRYIVRGIPYIVFFSLMINVFIKEELPEAKKPIALLLYFLIVLGLVFTSLPIKQILIDRTIAILSLILGTITRISSLD